MSELYVRVGASNPIKMTLTSRNEPINLASGVTMASGVEVVFRPRDKDYMDQKLIFSSMANPQTARFSDAPNGVIEILPSGTEFNYEHGGYDLYVWVHKSPGVKYDVPNRRDMRVQILRD